MKKMMKYVFLPASLAVVKFSLANTIGIYGATYNIAETDMIAGIYERLAKLEDSGELYKSQLKLQKNVLSHSIRPKRVSHVTDLPKDKKADSRYFDPSIRVTNDMKTYDGRYIAHKGDRLNPLSYKRFNETLVFINGDSKKQLDWVANNSITKAKIILVNGDVKKSSERIKGQVYFDQAGFLCNYFGIKHTPTLVYQPKKSQGALKSLVVKEVKIG